MEEYPVLDEKAVYDKAQELAKARGITITDEVVDLVFEAEYLCLAEIISILESKAKIGLTINDVRKELGYPEIEGGDVTLAGVHVQRLGQLMQEEQMKQQRQMEMQQFLAEQTGYNGDLDNVNGKDTYNRNVGKDGQVKGENNTNSTPQGGKKDDGSAVNDWEV